MDAELSGRRLMYAADYDGNDRWGRAGRRVGKVVQNRIGCRPGTSVDTEK